VSDKNVAGIRIGVPFTGRVSGAIESKAGPLPEPVSLSIRQTTAPYNQISVSSARAFAFDLPEGDYRVAAERLPDGLRIESITDGSTDLQAGLLRISRGDNHRLAVTLAPKTEVAPGEVALTSPLREVSGRFQIDGAAPANGIVGLRLLDASGPKASVIVDTTLLEPVFKIAVPEGEYRIDVLLPSADGPGRLRVKSAAYGSIDILGSAFRVSDSTDRIQIVIAPQ
jgi:hypothetical protein